LGCFAAFANEPAEIVRVHDDRQKDSHFIDGPRYRNSFRKIDEFLHNELEKLNVFIFHVFQMMNNSDFTLSLLKIIQYFLLSTASFLYISSEWEYTLVMAKGFKSMQYVPEEKNLESCDPCRIKGPDYPSLYVDSKQMPEIDSWKVGEEYEIKIRVKMSSYAVSDRGDGRSSASLSVEGYERENKKSLD
jgi:hypothetical protein